MERLENGKMRLYTTTNDHKISGASTTANLVSIERCVTDGNPKEAQQDVSTPPSTSQSTPKNV